jgi:hypothetical protein
MNMASKTVPSHARIQKTNKTAQKMNFPGNWPTGNLTGSEIAVESFRKIQN